MRETIKIKQVFHVIQQADLDDVRNRHVQFCIFENVGNCMRIAKRVSS